MSWPGAGHGIVLKTGILLAIETTWEFHNAAWLVCLPGCCIVRSAGLLPDKASDERSPVGKKKKKEKKMTHLAAPGTV